MTESYFSQWHGIDQISVNKKKKKSVSIPTLIISMISIAFVVVLVMAKMDDIKWFFWDDSSDIVETVKHLQIWDEVAYSWIVNTDWDMQNYTHTYNSEFGKIGLKSYKFDLNKYKWELYFEWIVEKIYHDMPVVVVNYIYSLDSLDESWFVDTWAVQNLYISKLWIYIPAEFFSVYSLLNEWDWNSIKVKNLQTNIITDIYYFKCDSNSKSDKNCDYLNDLYSKNNKKSITDKNWLTYYKDPEVNSWFFSNDSFFWFRINDSQDEIISDLSKYWIFVTNRFIDKNAKNVSDLCSLWKISLKNIWWKNLVYENSNYYYKLTGDDWENNNIACSLLVDLLNSNNIKLDDIEVTESNTGSSDVFISTWDNEKQETDEIKDESDNENPIVIWDESVQQFPINLDKKLTFTSSRWHSFVFPSSNLSYMWVSASEDFDQVWVNCFSAMNVVSYPNKEFVETNPSVIIYECSVKNTFDDSDKTLIYKNVWDRHFVIKIVDPAWINFANNIEINA